MGNIQDDFNCRSGDFELTPGEYEGPLVATRSCRIDGGGATLWAETGPVLLIDAPAVTVANLRVEVTGGAGQTAIQTNFPDTALSGVEVSGNVTGFPAEAAEWRLPPVISLGRFAAGEVNSFLFELELPMDARLSCGIKDLTVQPQALTRGRCQILMETGRIRENTILYGELLIRSTVTRRIYLSGRAEAGAPRREASRPVPLTIPEPLVRKAPSELIAPSLPDAPVQTVVRGQRLPVAAFPRGTLKAVFSCGTSRRPPEVDAYVFLLTESGKVRGDQDLIFFGNPSSANGSVSVSDGQKQPAALIRLEQVEAWVQKIAVCFAVYGENPGDTFSLAAAPALRVLAGETEVCRLPLPELGPEKAMTAVELYRRPGTAWKIHFIGAGYRSGLKPLCESYGVEVE